MTIEAIKAEELRRRYLVHQVETATPLQRLIMLFDSLVRDLEGARLAFVAGDIKEISDRLVHAQHIIFALRDPLDEETTFGHALRAVYTFCLARLVEANLRKDPSSLVEVQSLVEQIANANRQALAVPAEELLDAG